MKSFKVLLTLAGVLSTSLAAPSPSDVLTFSFYSLATEALDSGTALRNHSLYDCNQTLIVNVTEKFLKDVTEAGSGRLSDGRLIDLACHHNISTNGSTHHTIG